MNIIFLMNFRDSRFSVPRNSGTSNLENGWFLKFLFFGIYGRGNAQKCVQRQRNQRGYPLIRKFGTSTFCHPGSRKRSKRGGPKMGVWKWWSCSGLLALEWAPKHAKKWPILEIFVKIFFTFKKSNFFRVSTRIWHKSLLKKCVIFFDKINI